MEIDESRSRLLLACLFINACLRVCGCCFCRCFCRYRRCYCCCRFVAQEVRELLDPDKGGIGGSTRSGEAEERQEKLNQCQQELLKVCAMLKVVMMAPAVPVLCASTF